MQFFLDKLFAPLIAAMMGGFAAYMGIREDLREIKVRLAVVEKSADRSQDQIYQINRGGGK